MSRSVVTCFMYLLLALLLVGTGLSKAKAEGAGQEKAVMLPIVEVTAEKRTSDAQKTPLTMDVITAQEIEDTGIKTIHDVFKMMPNMVASDQFLGGTNFMTYRGAHTSVGTETNPIAIYVDDVPMESYQSLDINLANIERIEILKGAQGVVYGKNAYAGIIRIITKKPDNEMGGKVYSRMTSLGSYEVGGLVEGPILTDTLFYSLAVGHSSERGYLEAVDNVAREKDQRQRVKGQLRYTPSDDAEFAFHFDYSQMEKDQPHYSISPNASVSMTSLASDDDKEESSILNLGLTGSIVFDKFTVESISTERIEEREYAFDMRRIGFLDTGEATRQSEFTQEFRIRSNDDKEGLRWLLGLYGSYSDVDQHKAFQDMPPNPPHLPFKTTANGPYRMFSTEFAPFGQLEIPFADSWKIVTGLRWHYVHRDARVNYILNSPTGTLVDNSVHVKGSWSEILPRLTVSYDIDDDRMVYAGVSRSVIPGGICNFSMSGQGNLKYKSQKAWNYEVGAKTQWLDDRLRINPVLFYTIYKDLQEMAYEAASGNFVASNPGKTAHAYGAEADITYLITQGLTADATLGYTMAKYDEYTSPVRGEHDGNRVLMSPEWTTRIGLQYRDESGFFIRGDMNYTSPFYWTANNVEERSAVTTVDARIGWEFDNFDIYVFGKNIFGERYLAYFADSQKLAFAAETETFGLEMSYRF